MLQEKKIRMWGSLRWLRKLATKISSFMTSELCFPWVVKTPPSNSPAVFPQTCPFIVDNNNVSMIGAPISDILMSMIGIARTKTLWWGFHNSSLLGSKILWPHFFLQYVGWNFMMSSQDFSYTVWGKLNFMTLHKTSRIPFGDTTKVKFKLNYTGLFGLYSEMLTMHWVLQKTERGDYM